MVLKSPENNGKILPTSTGDRGISEPSTVPFTSSKTNRQLCQANPCRGFGATGLDHPREEGVSLKCGILALTMKDHASFFKFFFLGVFFVRIFESTSCFFKKKPVVFPKFAKMAANSTSEV